ncbi:MAG: DUF86 domain-containing protein [Phycisphaerae bacterium]
MTRDYRIYLQDILQAIDNTQEYVAGMSYSAFAADKKTISAVVRELEVIGEAVKNLPASVRKKHPGVPWSEMARMRDKLIHFYFGVDKEIVWKTVKTRLPELRENIQTILQEII